MLKEKILEKLKKRFGFKGKGPAIYTMLPDGRILRVTETEEWEKAVREEKDLYINFGIDLGEKRRSFMLDDYFVEHFVELKVSSYVSKKEVKV